MILDHMNLLLPLPFDIYILVVYTRIYGGLELRLDVLTQFCGTQYRLRFDFRLTSGRSYYRGFFFIVHVYHIISNLL